MKAMVQRMVGRGERGRGRGRAHLLQISLRREAEAIHCVGPMVSPLAKLGACLGEGHGGSYGTVH